jgi:hypothetical protein
MDRDTALDVLIETLELLVPIAKAVPALGTTVEGALEAAIKVVKFAQVRSVLHPLAQPTLYNELIFFQGVHTNKENTRELAAEAARWTEALVKALSAAPPALLPVLQGHVEEMTKCVQSLPFFISFLTDNQSARRNSPVEQATGEAELDKRRVAQV